MPPPIIRPALAGEAAALTALIRRSAAALSKGYYDDAAIAAASDHVFGVDRELIADGTYLVAEDEAGTLLGCGGWSRRETLFGGDQAAGRSSRLLDPGSEAARIRAFFVAPEAARRGVAAALLARCEGEAGAAGFARLALMATLPGVPFYDRHGFVAGAAVTVSAGGVPVRFVPMEKPL
jgi:GNAT superfamily N-acetyltransferase